MRGRYGTQFTWLMVAICAVAALSGCSKKVAPKAAMNLTSSPPAAPPAPVPSPTITLSASPDPIARGASTTLTWSTTHANSVDISGIGTVSDSGSRSVTPAESTTYTATATGPGGTATASARVTVMAPTPPPASKPLSDSEFFATEIKDVFFDFDKYNIRPDGQVTLENDAKDLEQRPEISFVIEGHCDERGSEKYNLALGDRRAQAAKKFLVAQGIATDRIDTVSYGKERPFDPGHDEIAWAKNRRDHLVMK